MGRGVLTKLKWKWQRWSKGYSDCDLWNLDFFYAEIISKTIREFSKDLYGCPEELTMEEWKTILDEIGDGFASYRELTYDDILEKKFDRAMILFFKYFEGLWS